MQWPQILGFTVVGALVTTAGTLIGLFLREVLLARSFERWKTKQSLAQVARKYREPIALSALELCNRFTNICDAYPPNFLGSDLLSSAPERPALNFANDPYFKRYRLVSTVYRLCSFLGWIELYRQDTTFLDVDESSGQRPVERAIYAVRADFADGQLNKAGDWQTWHDMLLFREEQRAIGESMIVLAGGVRTVMGYAEFCDLFPGDTNKSQSKWLHTAAAFLLDLKEAKDFRQIRFQRLIVHLVELVDVLSPARPRDEHQEAHMRYKKLLGTALAKI
ncbi:MAG TPA: hypothetical protein VK249_32180 [Anaerolineales bacterium]|nr:hypothetical protein [Anaerolineales bacterium]